MRDIPGGNHRITVHFRPRRITKSAKKNASRPVSRVLFRQPGNGAGGDGHSSGTCIAARLARPTRTAGPETRPAPAGSLAGACRPYSVLLRAGLAVPPLSPGARCALTAPFHPYPAPNTGLWLHHAVFGDANRPARGGLLSVALSLRFPRKAKAKSLCLTGPSPGVTRRPVSVEPGLSSRGGDLTAPGGHPAGWHSKM